LLGFLVEVVPIGGEFIVNVHLGAGQVTMQATVKIPRPFNRVRAQDDLFLRADSSFGVPGIFTVNPPQASDLTVSN